MTIDRTVSAIVMGRYFVCGIHNDHSIVPIAGATPLGRRSLDLAPSCKPAPATSLELA